MARGGGVELKLVSTANQAIQQINKLTTRVDDLTKSINKATASTEKMATKGISKVNNESNKLLKTMNNLNTRMDKAFNTGKMIYFWNITKRIRDTMMDIVKTAIDYRETQNLFEVSMNNNVDKAYKFRDALAEAFGLARTEIMNTQASFNNMLSSLGGISRQMSYELSEGLMLMSIDYSSLFNVSLDKTYEKFKSAISGMVKPIRDKTGMDITESTIQQVATNIGVTKSVRQLNQVEKRLLRIISLQDQMKKMGAVGDYAKTINEAANQLRILQEQTRELGLEIGRVFLKYLQPILPYLNAIVMTLVEIVKLIGKAFGVEETRNDFLIDPLEQADEATEELNATLDNTAEAIEKIKTASTGIDELNVLSQGQENAGAGGTSDSLTIDPAILAAITQYESKLQDVEMEARQIQARWLDMLGLMKDENGVWVLKEGNSIARSIYEWAEKTSNKMDEWKKKLENLGLEDIENTTKNIYNAWLLIKGVLETLLPLKFPFLAGLILLFDGIKEGNLMKTLEGIGLIIFWIGTILQSPTFIGLGLAIYGITKFLKDLFKVFDDGKLTIDEIIKLITDLALAVIGTILVGNLNGVLGLFKKCTGAALLFGSMILKALGGDSLAVAALTSMWQMIKKGFDNFVLYLKYLLNNIEITVIRAYTFIATAVGNLIAKFGTFLGLLITIASVVAIVAGAFSFFKTLTGLINGTISPLKGLLKLLSSVGLILAGIMALLGNWVGVAAGVALFVAAGVAGAAVPNKASKNTQTDEETQKNIDKELEKVNSKLDGLDINGLNLNTDDLDVKDLGLSGGMGDTTGFQEAVGNFNTAVNNFGTLIAKMSGVSFTPSTIAAYANGGFPTRGQLFLAREAGAELVGNIGGRTGVMNNEQISDTMYKVLQPMMASVVSSVQNLAAQDKTTVINVDSRSIARATQSGNKKNGYNQLGGVFANV